MEAPATIAGKYTLVRKIGASGFAEVYLARAAGKDGKVEQVMLRRVAPALVLNEPFVQLFQKVTGVMAALQHPNVLRILETGEDGGPFTVTEFVQGQNLRRVQEAARRKGGLHLAHALGIVLDLARGLHYAHELKDGNGYAIGIVHGDVAPVNVVLGYDGLARIQDFGMVWVEASAPSNDPSLLTEKFPYMSPERVCGAPLDRRSDLFSLALVLYELVTGVPAFQAATPKELMARIIECKVAPPSSHREGFPAELEAVVLRALARVPDERFPTCEAFAKAIQQAMQKRNLSTTPALLGGYLRGLFGAGAVAESAPAKKPPAAAPPASPVKPPPRPPVRPTPSRPPWAADIEAQKAEITQAKVIIAEKQAAAKKEAEQAAARKAEAEQAARQAEELIERRATIERESKTRRDTEAELRSQLEREIEARKAAEERADAAADREAAARREVEEIAEREAVGKKEAEAREAAAKKSAAESAKREATAKKAAEEAAKREAAAKKAAEEAAKREAAAKKAVQEASEKEQAARKDAETAKKELEAAREDAKAARKKADEAAQRMAAIGREIAAKKEADESERVKTIRAELDAAVEREAVARKEADAAGERASAAEAAKKAADHRHAEAANRQAELESRVEALEKELEAAKADAQRQAEEARSAAQEKLEAAAAAEAAAVRESETARSEAEAARAEVEAARRELSAAKRDSEAGKRAAATVRKKWEAAEKEKADLKAEVESMRRSSDEARREQEILRRDTDSIRRQGEASRRLADAATLEAEAAKRVAEAATQEAEAAKREAEVHLQELQAAQEEIDALRQEVEALRADNETFRAAGDAARVEAETLRQEAETIREQAEAARQEAEAARLEALAAAEHAGADDPAHAGNGNGNAARIGVSHVALYLSALADAPRTNLTADPGNFVGREEALLALDLLLKGDDPVLTLAGGEGSGRTRLARRFASTKLVELSQEGGAWFVEMAAVRDVEGVCHAIGTALSIALSPELSETETVKHVGAALAARGRMLLVLDGVDGIAEPLRRVIAEWTGLAPSARFLLVGRAPIGLEGERTRSLGPLGLPTPASPIESEAMALFVTRARERRRQQGAGAEAGLPVIAKIVKLLEGNPLAIELVAARADVGAPSKLHAELGKALHREETRVGGILPLVLEWVWSQLAAPERDALAQCALFLGSFTAEAAEDVIDLAAHASAPPEHEVLRALRSRGLLVGDDLLLELHPSVRAFALGRLSQQGAEAVEAAAARHATRTLRAGRSAAKELERAGSREALRRLQLETGNLLAVLERALAETPQTAASATQALETVRCLAPAVDAVGPYEAGLGWMDAALQAAGSLAPKGAGGTAAVDKRLRAEILLARGRLRRRRGDVKGSTSDLYDAHDIAAVGDDRGFESSVLAEVGLTLQAKGKLEEGRKALEQALNLARMVKDELREAQALAHLATLHDKAGRAKDAQGCFHEAAAAFARCGDRRSEGAVLSAFGAMLQQRGDAASARPLLEKALALHQEVRDRAQEGATVGALAAIALESGDCESGRELFQRAISLQQERGDRRAEAILRGNLGILEHLDGRMEEARGHFVKAIWILGDLNDPQLEGLYLAFLAALVTGMGTLDTAAESFDLSRRQLAAANDTAGQKTVEILSSILEVAKAKQGRDRGAADAVRAAAIRRAEDSAAAEPECVRFARVLVKHALTGEAPARGGSRAPASGRA